MNTVEYMYKDYKTQDYMVVKFPEPDRSVIINLSEKIRELEKKCEELRFPHRDNNFAVLTKEEYEKYVKYVQVVQEVKEIMLQID